ncbi:MAG: ribosome biogenesis GTPase YlqF, partial [Clostridia bacterium]
MNIQWFPGHMTKAIRMMEENLRLVDALIYVIDARAIYSCSNPLLEKLTANKKVLYVFNKCDLVSKTDL